MPLCVHFLSNFRLSSLPNKQHIGDPLISTLSQKIKMSGQGPDHKPQGDDRKPSKDELEADRRKKEKHAARQHIETLVEQFEKEYGHLPDGIERTESPPGYKVVR